MATPLQYGLMSTPQTAPVAALSNTFGGSHKGQSSWQSGSGLNDLTPEQLATVLGTRIGQIGYDSNQKGSFEGNYNTILNSLSPDLLIKRYGSINDQNSFNTSLDKAQKQMYDSFKSQFNRDPTTAEWNMIAPAFQGPNGLINGRAALANLLQQYKSNPQLDPSSSFNNQKPEDVSNTVAQQFQSILGRPATADELQHFSQAIQTGQIDAYGLSSFLKQQPEYTNAQDSKFRQGLNSELQNYDTQEFNRMKGDVISAYGANGMAAGFDPNGKSLSPSLDYALTDMMGKIASNRSAYLANLSASQYGGNKDLAIGNYQNTLGQMYNQNQQNLQGQRQYGQQLLNQGFQGSDYLTQKNDFMNYANSIPKQKPNFFDYLNTGANVAGAIGSFA